MVETSKNCMRNKDVFGTCYVPFNITNGFDHAHHVIFIQSSMTFSHKLVAYWDKGTQINSPVQRDLSAGVAFSGRSYRLNGSQTRTAEQAETNTPAQEPNQADGVAFRGRGYRLNGR
jgi:hypothetical protein